MSLRRRDRAPAAILAIVLTAGAALAEQDQLSVARDLYTGAAYEEALQLLNRLRAAGAHAEDASAIEQYRAFCLLALGRSADAEQAIEAVVQAQPLYQPSTNDHSPRLRTAFRDVRKRVLPTIVLQKYAAAKASYDRKAWAEAERGFKQVLEVLDDPDVAPVVSQPPLSDMRTLAIGFHELSAAAAAPPPPPPPPPPPAPVEPPPPAPIVAGPPRIYTAGDPGVVPPVAIRQALPPFPAQSSNVPAPRPGVMELVIDERGAVESVVMRTSVSPVYDRQAVQAARSWEYRPAMLDGKPVKFRKVVQITVQR